VLKKLMSLLLCLILSFAIVGCSGPKPEESVKGYFDALKKQDIQAAQGYMQNGVKDISTDAQQEKLLKQIFSKLNYEIVSSTVQKDTAVIKVNVTAPDLAIVTGNMFKDLLGQLFTLAFSGTEDIEAKSAQLTEEYFTKALADPQVVVITSEVDINLVKDSNTKKWIIVSDEKLANAVTGNFVTAMKSLSGPVNQ
jgi:uncharacterized lipoprotein YehR (DUF1307 family)